MPDDLKDVRACISPGVSSECGFDLEIAGRGIDVYMADASVDGPPIQHSRFEFVKKFLDTYESATTTTLDQFCRVIPDHSSQHDLVLQMDIEGAEYRVVHNMSDDLLRRFRIMVIEFHNLEQLFSRFSFGFMRSTFEKLVQHHNVVHIHPNNFSACVRRRKVDIPPIMEFTFYRKDRASFSDEIELQFPHTLDRDNVPERPRLVLPECWR